MANYYNTTLMKIEEEGDIFIGGQLMNIEETRKKAIESVLAAMSTGDLLEKSKELLATIGYRSERTLELSGTADDFFEEFPALNPNTKTEQEFRKNAESVKLVFQFTSDEITDDIQQRLFESDAFDKGNTDSFLFCAIELKNNNYSRTKYAEFTREINKRLGAPTVGLFRVASRLTIGFTDRRPHKTEEDRDVLGQVTLIKDIRLDKPHRAHLDIMSELSFEDRVNWMDANKKPKNFDSLLAAWLAKLDTEELNKQFYQKLFNWYEWTIAEATFPINENRVLKPEEHVIRLITRLLFIWFLKEKELIAEKLFNRIQIQDLLTEDDFDNGDSYYRTVLQNLFFATLNTEIGKRGFSTKTNKTHRNFSRYRYKAQIHDPDALLTLFAQTPFINGGLFDCLDSEEATKDGGYRIDCFSDEQYKKLSIPNRLFFDKNRGLFRLFEHYKFTVEENTPIEQEVALDPELLGRVFEHLLAEYNPETREIAETARKETGSYYTPRPIVDYMVEEALVATISQKCNPTDSKVKRWKKRLRYLFNYNHAYDNPEKRLNDNEEKEVVRTISELKILDPAVGSGAFPMGVLHKLTLALRRLDPDNSQWEKLQKELATKRASEAFDTSNQQERETQLTEISHTFEHYRDSDFGRKLYLIQNSIFGVDIQPVACQIAKLRFFISLAIEQETDKNADNFGIKPLPNLETRFVAANTLIGFKEQRTFTNEVIQNIEQKLRDNGERHFHAITRQQKLACKKDDQKFRRELATELRRVGMPIDAAEKIAHWDRYDQNKNANWFVSKRMFGITNGFDVVIGNPPYAKSEHVPEDRREELKTHYGWSGDLYDHFIFAGFDLVSEEGIFSYIANDSFVTFSTKRRIRDLFLQNQLIHLVKAPANTFEAQIYTAIFILLKRKVSDSHVYMSGGMNFPDFQYHSNGEVDYATIHKIPDCKFMLSPKNDWVLRLFSLENVEKHCFVLDTGIDSGNVRAKIFFQENNGRRHRLLQGRQIRRFSVEWNSPKAKYKFCDVDYEPLPIPGIGRGGKPSKRNEYWKFRGDIVNHHQPERLLMRQTDDDLIVAYHSEEELGRFYTDNTLHTVLPKSQKTNLKYFLALFNSRLLNFVYHSISQEQGKSQAQVKIKVVQKLPVVVPSEEEQLPIIKLVDEILAVKAVDPGKNTTKQEEKIDKLIYDLYNLTSEEKAIVEAAEG
jgi:hypothetical protein